MDKKIKNVGLILRKINFLFESIESNPLQSSNLEMALLKRYAVDLYDTILEYEESEHYIQKEPKGLLQNAAVSESLSSDHSAIDHNTEENSDKILSEILNDEHEMDIKEEVTEDLTSILEEVKRKSEDQSDLTFHEQKIVSGNFKEDSNTEINFESDPFSDPIPEPDPFTEPINDLSYDSRTEIIEPEINIFDEFNEEEPPPKVFDILEKNIQNKEASDELPPDLVDDNKTDVLTNIAQKVRLNHFDSRKVDEPFEQSQTPTNLGINNIQEPDDEFQLIDKLRAASHDKKTFSISYNNRFAFINELFDGDASTFDRTLEELGKCKNVIEAFTYLNLHVKMQYQWHDDEPLVKEFQQMVKDRFLGDD